MKPIQSEITNHRYPKTWEANLLVAAVSILALIGGAASTIVGLIPAMIVTQALVILPALLWMALRHYPVKETLRLSPVDGRTAMWSALIGLSSWPVVAGMATLIEQVLERIGPGPELPYPTGWVEGILYALVLILLAPLTEEPVFRGFVLSAWLRRGVAAGLVMSGLLFALLHFQLSALIPLTYLGIVLGLLVQRCNSLYASMSAHACYNIIGTLFIVFPSLRATPEPIIITAGAIFLPVSAVLLWGFARRFPAPAEISPPRESSSWIWTALSFVVVLGISGFIAVVEVSLRLSPSLASP